MKMYSSFLLKMKNRFSSPSSEEGAVLALFAVILFPLVLLICMAVEFSRQAYLNTQLAYACDAAAIAGARYSLEDLQTNASKFFYANYSATKNGNVNAAPTISLSSDNKYVTVSTVATMPTMLGFNLRVSGYSQVFREIYNVEVAMVLDTTGSMAENNKFAGLKSASKALINAIYGSNITIPQTAISIIPYAVNVNIGTSYTSWLSSNPTSTFPSKVPWEGCVAAIDTNNVMDTDAPPSTSRKWPFYYVPSTLNQYSGIGDNDWKQNSNGTITIVNSLYSGDDIGPNKFCSQPILPLTNNRDTLLAKIDSLAMVMGGGTFSNLGLVWGWNTISPKWSGKWTTSSIQAQPYSSNTEKTVIIVTDGENQWYDTPYVSPNSDPTAYGRITEGKLGTTSLSQARTKIDARVSDLCTKMKTEDIQIFTVTFRVSDLQAQTLFRNCATKPEWALQADNNQELADRFLFIASQIRKITIVK